MVSLRRFYLNRVEDVSGISGKGRVAEGVLLPSGRCVIEWISNTPTITIFKSMAHLVKIHSHDGKTKVVWVDKSVKKNILQSEGYVRY